MRKCCVLISKLVNITIKKILLKFFIWLEYIFKYGLDVHNYNVCKLLILGLEFTKNWKVQYFKTYETRTGTKLYFCLVLRVYMCSYMCSRSPVFEIIRGL